MGEGIPKRAEPGARRADRLPELQVEHDEARAANRAGTEPLLRRHQPG